MPYVKGDRRRALRAGAVPSHPGELNYLLTTIVNEYVEHAGLSYQSINDVVGAYECAKAEFNRRVVVPYEDTKMRENGDVFPSSLLSLPRVMAAPDDGTGRKAGW